MSQNKSILVATIGTRDLAYQDSSREWLNVGNDRAEGGKSQMGQVKEDLSTEPGTPPGLEDYNFRSLTQYLSENFQKYKDRLQPIILGKLLQDEHQQLQKIYLVATDQAPIVKERIRDTRWVSEIIQQWIKERYEIPTELVLQGCRERENPANFEEIFVWWKQTWQEIAEKTETKTRILLCLKAGVNQSSIASQITALDRFGENTRFYDFQQDEVANREGKPSLYTPPIKGTNYLWDRKQREAISLLNRFDYSGVSALLAPDWENASDDPMLMKIYNLLQLATQWNIADLENFKQLLATAVRNGHFQKTTTRSQCWWWTGYEAAYLSVIRFKQRNIIEALFHSVRAVEGLMSEWAILRYSDHIKRETGKSPTFKRSVCDDPKFPELLNFKREFEDKQQIYLYGVKLNKLLKAARPEAYDCEDLKIFFGTTREWRNQIFHRLLRLREEDLFQAWDTKNAQQWEVRVLNCLNFLSEQNSSLKNASLMPLVEKELYDAIASYNPK